MVIQVLEVWLWCDLVGDDEFGDVVRVEVPVL